MQNQSLQNILKLQAVWHLKARALTSADWIDDTEVEEEVHSYWLCQAIRHTVKP